MKIQAIIFDMYGVLIESRRALLPGVREVLRELRERGYRLCVATSIGRAGMEEILGKFEIREFFEVCSCGDDVEWNKPAPDVYLRCSELMGLEASECLVVEDTASYLAGIEAAGFKTVLMGEGGCGSLSELTKLL